MKKTPKEDYELLYESLLQLKSVEECRKFMEDLCTVTELKAMGQRIEVAMYLREGIDLPGYPQAHRGQQRHHQPGQPLPAIRRRRLPDHPAPPGPHLGGEEAP